MEMDSKVWQFPELVEKYLTGVEEYSPGHGAAGSNVAIACKLEQVDSFLIWAVVTDFDKRTSLPVHAECWWIFPGLC